MKSISQPAQVKHELQVSFAAAGYFLYRPFCNFAILQV